MKIIDAVRSALARRAGAGATARGAGNPAAPLAPPTVPRLNRNALTIGAAAIGMLTIAAVVLIQPAPQVSAAGAPAPPVPSGTFLDRPLRDDRAAERVPNAPPAGPSVAAARPPGVTAPGFGGTTARPSSSGSVQSFGTSPTQASADAYAASGEVDAGAGTMLAGGAYPPPYAAPAARPPTIAALRTAAYRRALLASASYQEARSEERTSTAAAGTPQLPAGRVTASDVDPHGFAGAEAPMAGETSQDDRATAPEDGARGRHAAFLAGAAERARTVRALTVDDSPGPFAVQAGTVIPAVLVTEINSDLPGECLAQTTRDVFDSRTQHVLLIPRGAKLLCRYDDQLGAGQSRLLVAWTRILLPDGRSVQLPGLPATDRAGARGVSDQVDRHARKTFATAGALSLLTAAVQLSQPQNGNVLAASSAGQVAAAALGQQLNQVSVEMLRRDLTNQQTIRIRQGTQFNVFLNADLAFPGPYADGGAGDRLRAAALRGLPPQ